MTALYPDRLCGTVDKMTYLSYQPMFGRPPLCSGLYFIYIIHS